MLDHSLIFFECFIEALSIRAFYVCYLFFNTSGLDNTDGLVKSYRRVYAPYELLLSKSESVL